ncbi:MAG: class I SAM-dependent methyltransferase [Oscillospiraceae bacterium]|nr:class I SAM-dependent methyltransferase [Oscillospiraceae bacterium]
MEQAKLKSKKTFNHQAATYDHDAKGQHARKLYPALVNTISGLSYETILDLGCGTGAVLKRITDNDARIKAYGVDFSENMLAQAKQKLGDSAILTFGDAEHLPFDNEFFDVVYCNDSFHHYPSPEAVLAEVRRVLKKNGVFVLCDIWIPAFFRSITNCLIRFSSEGDVRFYSRKEICGLLSRYFHTVTWDRITDTGFMSVASKNIKM